MPLTKFVYGKNRGGIIAPKNKSAQLQVTFNWVFILIAGAVILLFFVGIVMKQKTASEENLAVDVVNIMESIFTGAGVSEQTKNFIDISGLADYTLKFDCDEGVSTFGLEGQSYVSENKVLPIFSPAKIQATQLILWSLPYHLPFKVTDLLFVTSASTKYVLLGSDTNFVNEFLNATEGFNVVYAQEPGDIDLERNFQLRVVDLDGTLFEKPFPSQLAGVDDDKVSAVSFVDSNKVKYYQKKGSGWDWPEPRIIEIVSLGGEKDAAKYAAIFAADGKNYDCNMQKAFQRLEYLVEIYGGEDVRSSPGGKFQDMVNYYIGTPRFNCLGLLQEYSSNLGSNLAQLQNMAKICLRVDYPESCSDLAGLADSLQQLNQNLNHEDCLTLY